MSRENPLWGAPRIRGELLKLGYEVSESTIAKYIVRRPGPPSEAWRTFVSNHMTELVAIDIYGQEVVDTLRLLERERIVTTPRSPWQNGYCERVIGTIRRECLDHVIALNERHLRRVLREYLAYYHRSRTHLGLGKDTPDRRTIETLDSGPVVSEPILGGLHHRYYREAA
jgi:hypothetical protein